MSAVSAFAKANRNLPMWHHIAWKGVPEFRAIALLLDLAEHHGAPHLMSSADRRDDVIKAFNKKYHTHLHGQEWCIRMHARDPAHYAPANPTNQTSHCLHADATIARLFGARGRRIRVGGVIPDFALGQDAQDIGPHARANDCSHLVAVINHLAGHTLAVQPYKGQSSENHHFILLDSPMATLRRHKIVR